MDELIRCYIQKEEHEMCEYLAMIREANEF